MGRLEIKSVTVLIWTSGTVMPARLRPATRSYRAVIVQS